MKKLFLTLAATLMVFAAVAGSASAAFVQGDLTLVIYAEGDNEIALNLGDASEIDFSAQNVELAAAGSWTLADFEGELSLDDLAIGGWSIEGAAYTETAYIISTDTVSLNMAAMSSSISASNFALYNYSHNVDTDNADKAIGSTSNINSYDNKMNVGSNSPGAYGNLVAADDQEEGEFDLDLGYVDLILSSYELIFADGGYVLQDSAVLRVYTDGSVVLNPVPVPGGLLLLSSALLVLTGIRRKNS